MPNGRFKRSRTGSGFNAITDTLPSGRPSYHGLGRMHYARSLKHHKGRRYLIEAHDVLTHEDGNEYDRFLGMWGPVDESDYEHRFGEHPEQATIHDLFTTSTHEVNNDGALYDDLISAMQAAERDLTSR